MAEKQNLWIQQFWLKKCQKETLWNRLKGYQNEIRVTACDQFLQQIEISCSFLQSVSHREKCEKCLYCCRNCSKGSCSCFDLPLKYWPGFENT